MPGGEAEPVGQQDGGGGGDQERRHAGGAQRAGAVHHPAKLPHDRGEGERGERGHPDAAEPEIEEGDRREGEAGGHPLAEITETDLRWRRAHPATAPKRRSRVPKPPTWAANMSAVKSGHRVSMKANSE